MFRQMGIGALATIVAGTLAVGCSDDGGGGGGFSGQQGVDLLLQSFTGSSIASNNLDSDGAGFSPNNTTAQEVKAVFSTDLGNSDGTFGGDSSAMVLFRVTDLQTVVPNQLQRVLASHYNGSTFTPPVELQAEDRNELVATNVQAAVMIQLSTAQYGATQTTLSTAANDARANDGNWLILWDYTTQFVDPRLATNSTTNAVGAHRTIAATVFLKAERGNAVVTSSKVGATARTFRYGFQEVGLEVPSIRTGAVTGHTVANVIQPTRFPPASSVQSFGLISDGFCAQSSFGGDALPFSDAAVSVVSGNAAGGYTYAGPNTNGAVLRSADYDNGEATNFIHLFYTQVVSSLSGGGSFTTPGGASDGGADLAAFNASFNMATLVFGTKTEFSAPVERGPTTSATLKSGTAFYPTFHTYNQHIFYKYADASLNTNIIAGSDQLSLAPGGANALVQDRVFNHEGKDHAPASSFYEDIIGFATVVDAGDGTSTLGATSAKRDLTLRGTQGAHDTTNCGSNSSATINILVNREMMNFNGNGGDDQSIFGADEGLGDTTIFYLAADSTRDATGSLAGDLNPTNIDATIVAAVIDNAGAFSAGVNPRRVSVHKGDFFNNTDPALTAGSGGGSTDSNTLQDAIVEQGSLSGVGGNLRGRNGSAGSGPNVVTLAAGQIPVYVRIAMNRTGQYIALNWIQDQGVSSLGGLAGGAGFYQALFTTVYQTFRPGTTGTGTTSTAAAVEARFATAPLEVSIGNGSLALSQNVNRATDVANNGAETNRSWIGLPVNWSSWQGSLGYRCGFQSNNLIMNMFWEQSDGTEDRLFVRDITVTLGATGTPAVVLGTTAEFDATPSVQGHESVNQFQGSVGNQSVGPATNSRDTFTFLDGGIYSFASTDLGPDAQVLTATNQGGVLVVLGKVIDNTNTDNELADGELAMFEVVRGASTIAQRTSLSRNINENAVLVTVREATTGSGEEAAILDAFGNPLAGSTDGTLTQFRSTNADAANNYATLFDTGTLLQLVSTPNNTSIDNTLVNHSPTRVDIIFSDSRTDNNSGARVLYARKYDSADRAAAAPKATAGERLTPNGSVGATGALEPTRLDRLQGGNVTAIVTSEQAGAAILVLWRQDGHLWAQYTSDGTTYVTTSSAPTPPLVDDNSSENVNNQTFVGGYNSSCDLGDGVLFIFKNDITGADSRVYARGVVRTR